MEQTLKIFLLFILLVGNCQLFANKRPVGSIIFPKGKSFIMIKASDYGSIDFNSCNCRLPEGVDSLRAFVITNVDEKNSSATLKRISCLRNLGTVYNQNKRNGGHQLCYDEKIVERLRGDVRFYKNFSLNDDVNRFMDTCRFAFSSDKIYMLKKSRENHSVLFNQEQPYAHGDTIYGDYLSRVKRTQVSVEDDDLYIVVCGTPGATYQYTSLGKSNDGKKHGQVLTSPGIHGCFAPVVINRLANDTVTLSDSLALKVYLDEPNERLSVKVVKVAATNWGQDRKEALNELYQHETALNKTGYALSGIHIYYVGSKD